MGATPGPIWLPERCTSRGPNVHVESVDVCSIHVVPEEDAGSPARRNRWADNSGRVVGFMIGCFDVQIVT